MQIQRKSLTLWPAVLTFNEVHRHLQTVSVLVTIVQNVRAQRKTRQKVFVLVDSVYGEEHCLEGLDSTLGHDGSTGDRIFSLVHHHEATQDQVALDDCLPLDRPGGGREAAHVTTGRVDESGQKVSEGARVSVSGVGQEVVQPVVDTERGPQPQQNPPQRKVAGHCLVHGRLAGGGRRVA